MPIRPENRARYPKNWKEIRARILERAGNRCEGSPAYPDCRAINGAELRQLTRATVVLTIAHLNHIPEDCRDENLRAWCQKCHNTYDMPMRRAGIRARAKAERAISDLFAQTNGQHCDERHLHRYLAEFDFRYSNRAKLGVTDKERADKALKGIEGKRLTYRRTEGQKAASLG